MHAPAARPRARDLGVPFPGCPGPMNAITDVTGVEVGYTTLIADRTAAGAQQSVRTGVTAILPYGRDGVGTVASAGWHSFNGNGEMTGTTWIEETGALGTPILLTNTHAVGPCHQGVTEWIIEHRPEVARQWLLPVVAETWDGYLNDTNGAHVSAAHARAAIDAATAGPPAEGAVGGGTGMTCYGFKGGSGTASRTVPYADEQYTVAAFVQANFGRRHELTVAGVRVGELLAEDNPEEDSDWFAPPGAGSVIVVIATDAPLLPGQCKALARRAPLGLARTGTSGSHFSGDIVLAFSTANPDALSSNFPTSPAAPHDYRNLRFIPWGHIDPFYAAAVHATEEAVINALVAADTMVGRNGHRSPGIPTQRVAELLGQHQAVLPNSR